MNSKTYPTIGACGIDCGLCPRYQSKAASRCPGCAPEGFLDRGGQWCKMTRCAVRDRGYETCAECPEFPCSRFDGWDEGDSFVSHLRSIDNLLAIREHGLEAFAVRQRLQIDLLEAMLEEFDEGRSRSYCCLAAALLPVEILGSAVNDARRDADESSIPGDDRKSRARILHRHVDRAAERMNIHLKLRRGTE